MKRLIDANDLIEIIETLQVTVGGKNCVNEHYKQSILDLINNMPSAEKTAMRPEYEADGYDNNGALIYDTAYCPVCHREFEYEINEWGCAYCPDCGQALDWEAET